MARPEHAVLMRNHAGALAGYPHARRVGNLIFVCGTSSRRADNTHEGVTIHPDGTVETDTAEQTRAVLRNIDRILREAGASLDHVVDATTFLVDMADFPEYNRAWNEFFEAPTAPTRTTVAVHQLPHPHLRIEIKVIAVLDDV